MTAQRLRLGVDFGTSTTIAMLQRPDGRVQPLLFDGSPLMSSAVLLGPDGRLHTGKDAAHLARSAPERLEPNPKRRIDDTSVLLGDAEVSVKDLVVAVLSRVAHEAGRVAGPVRDIALTHPANWGQGRRAVLIEAARQVGFSNVELVGEPTAAATYFAHIRGDNLPVGACVLVYDLGAGTCDVTLLRRQPQGFEQVASDGLNDVGGLDVDAAVIAFLQATYGELWTSPATRRQLWDDVRSAKEMLSRASGTVVMVPALGKEVPLGREQLEGLARPVLRQTISMTRGLVMESGVAMSSVAGLFLVGGSSRIPLVATLLHEALGIAPVVAEQPELVVAEGSLYLNFAPGTAQVTQTAGPIPSAPTSPPSSYSAAIPVSPTSGQFSSAAPVSPTSGQFAAAPVTGVPASPVSPSGPYSPSAPVSANPAYMNPVSAPRRPAGPYGGPPAGPYGAPPSGPPSGPPVGYPTGPQGPPPYRPPAGPPPGGFAAPRQGRSPVLVAVLAVVALLVVIGGGVGLYKAMGNSGDGSSATGNGPSGGASGTTKPTAGGGGAPVLGTDQPGKYDLLKPPEDLCKTVDTSQFNSVYDKSDGAPQAIARQLSNVISTAGCQFSRSRVDTKTSAVQSGSVSSLVYVYNDVSQSAYYQKYMIDNAKLNGQVTDVPGLGESAALYKEPRTAEQEKTVLFLTIVVQDSNLRLEQRFSASRSDSAGWTESEQSDLKAKLIATAKATLSKTTPGIKR